MAPRRTTLFLDEAAEAAARQLARRYGCSMSEAIRRSVIAQRDSALGVTGDARGRRLRALRRLYALFDGHDAAAEVKRLKQQDEGF